MAYDYRKSIKESDVLRNCLTALKYLGIYAWRNNTGSQRTKEGGFVSFGFKGSSDIIGITHDGRFLGIECKRPVGGRLSEDQKKFMDTINAFGGVAIVTTSDADMVSQLKEKGVI